MTSSPCLDDLRNCLEGVIPSVIATVSAEGTPNVTYVSQVHYVDGQHVALSFQFFNKTRENILANPNATVQLIDPDSAAIFRLHLRYLRTESVGPLFESMKAKLAAIAAHTGMSKVFHLLGADIYEVKSVENIACQHLVCHKPSRNRLGALRDVSRNFSYCKDTSELFNSTLDSLHQYFEIGNSMLLIYDNSGDRLYTVASHGYAISGIGAEIPLGAGVIGVAAAQRTPIRIVYTTGECAYSRAVREHMQRLEPEREFETAIPFPGLPSPHSQMAVPILHRDLLLGILYVESNQEMRFTYEDEDSMIVIAKYLALGMVHFRACDESDTTISLAEPEMPAKGDNINVRHFMANDSIFVGDDYLIKGVAGAILWKLLNEFVTHQRVEFSNRELRLDASLGLPDIGDNLETRLILLQNRLAERIDSILIEKSGRGRFRLVVKRPLTLQQIS